MALLFLFLPFFIVNLRNFCPLKNIQQNIYKYLAL